MNKLFFNQPMDQDYNVTIVIRKEQQQQFMDDFYPWCEMEILSGIKTELDDHIEYKFNLDDDKAQQLKQFMISGLFPGQQNNLN